MAVQLTSRYLAILAVGGRTFRFQTFDGGHATSAAVASRPPGSKYPRQGGGEPELAPVTVGKDYDVTTDDDMLSHLRKFLGVEDAATVQRQGLDSDRNPYGAKDSWTGVLIAINVPTSDTNATADKATLTVEMQPSSGPS